MAMSFVQAEAIVRQEGDAVVRFINYLDDPGIRLYFRVEMMAAADDLEEGRLFYKLYRQLVNQLVQFDGVGVTAAAPALAMIVAVIDELVKDADHDEAVFPSKLIPSEETVEAYLTLFHKGMGYTQDSDGPHDAPADEATKPSADELAKLFDR